MRRWTRFSLRALLLATAVCAVIAHWCSRAIHQEEAIQLIEAGWGYVLCTHEPGSLLAFSTDDEQVGVFTLREELDRRPRGLGRLLEDVVEPPGPEWLKSFVGR